jgi:hypothetical protein
MRASCLAKIILIMLYIAPHYAIFSSLLLFHPPLFQYSPQHPLLKHHQCSPLNVRGYVSNPYTTTGELILLYKFSDFLYNIQDPVFYLNDVSETGLYLLPEVRAY